MPQIISDVLVQIVNFLWGLPLAILLIGGGFYLCLATRFLPLKGFIHAWKLLLGLVKHQDDIKAKGQISHFKALSNALASTIGMGNIAGVALALTQGGPGAIFWMWVAAFIGMITKYSECTLALLYRGQDYKKETQGGPMYTIEKALPKKVKFLAYSFASASLLASFPLFNANQMAQIIQRQYEVPMLFTGVCVAILIYYILSGGIKRLANATSSLVPFMCVGYVLSCLLIILLNYQNIPEAFGLIFKGAFTGKAAFGGASGVGLIYVLQIGVKRSAFSNEAGVGTAAMAHSNAKTSEPVAEGLVAMLGPFIDTIVVCTMTALVILTSIELKDLSNTQGVLLTAKAFENHLGSFGAHALTLATVLFALTTIIGGANYAQKCFDYLFKGRFIFKDRFLKIIFAGCLIISSLISMTDAINLLDIAFALMAVPNMIATLWLAPKLLPMTRRYFDRYCNKDLC